MSSEDVVHIKLEYGEALSAKRDILFSEMESLKAAKTVGRYRIWRLAELNLKGKIYTKMKETKANIRKLQDLLPEPKVPRILKRVQTAEAHATEKPEYHSEEIESQLIEIQRRLEQLQG